MNTFSSLSPFLKTVQERNMFLSELELVKHGLFSTQPEAIQHVLQNQVRHDVSVVLASLLGDQQSAAKTLETLEKYVHDLLIVQVTLAFDPTPQQLEQISEMIQTAEEIPRLLDIEVNPEVIGGMQIAVNGKYADYTLKKKMTTYWKEKGLEIIKKFFEQKSNVS